MDNSGGSLVPLDGGRSVAARPFYANGPGWDEDAEARKEGWWASVSRHRNGIFFLLILCIGVALLGALLTPPTYRAETQVEFQDPLTAGTAARSGATEAEAARYEQTQLGLVRSRALAQQVSDRLKLPTNPRLVSALGGETEEAPLSDRAATDLLRERVGVALAEDARLATIHFDSREPLVSALIANTYADTLIRASIQRQQGASAGSQDFLRKRLAEAKDKLASSEKALIDYTRQAGLIDPSAGTSSVTGQTAPHSLASEKLAQMNQAYSMTRAERVAAEQRWREAQSAPLMSLPEVMANPAIQQLIQKGAEQQAVLEQERQRRTDQHPAVVQAAAQIAEINRQINSIAGNIRGTIRERAESARREEAVLSGTLNRLEGQTLADQSKGVRYNVLKREADTNRQEYDALLQRLNELSVTLGVPANRISMLDRAAAPKEPIAPRPEVNAALGGAAGLALSLLYLFGIRILDDSVHSPVDLDSRLRLPLLSVLPRVKRPVEALEDPGSPLCEALQSLRATLELTCTEADRKIVLFTSSGEGEGKSTTAYGVARTFALSGARVLLVDADMRRPSIHRFFNVSPGIGLSTVLSELSDVDEAILETSIENLCILPSGPVPASPAALLGDKRFAVLLKRLSASFDMLVVDAPPVFGLADTPRLATVASSVVFVVEADRSKIANVRTALRRLAEARANLVGAVLTKFDIRRASSGAETYVYDYRRSESQEQLTAA